MADVQHSTLASADCHEPKHVSGATIADAGKVITPNGTGTSELRKLRADEIDEATGKIPFMGFQYWEDGTAGQTGITGGVRTKISIDGLGSQTTSAYEPAGASNWWNAGTGKIIPESQGDVYIIRFDFDISASGGSGTIYYTIDIDIGGSLGVIYQQSYVIPKATSFTCREDAVVFVGSTFIVNGGEVYINCQGSTSDPTTYDITNKGIMIARLSKGS